MNLVNPYDNLLPITVADSFFGRERLMIRVFSAIANRQSVSLTGQRQIGKSSMLACMRLPEVQQRYGYDGSRHILVLLDLRTYLHRTADDFFASVNEHIIAQCRKYGELIVTERDESGADAFVHLLEQIEEQSFHVVLLLDAFDNIAKNPRFDPEFFSFLRSQAPRVSYVTASNAPLAEICHSTVKDSPFFSIFMLFPVGPLTRDEARSLLIVPSTRAGCPFTEDEVNWVLDLAGHHPFFIQRVCHFLFEEKSLQRERGAKANLYQIIELAYADLLPRLRDIWSRLSEEKQQMLKAEVLFNGIRRREFPEFSESTLFRKFVLDQYRMRTHQLTKDGVEKALVNLNDARFLGESNLKYLRVVADRLRKDSIPSTVETGMAVREVLIEAFERLRGSGTRHDTGNGWQVYNILYYRYFKYHLKHAQIAARLQFSQRQYFRERNKALQELYNTIIELEANYGKEVGTEV